jgi:hypothetical protein
MPPIVPDTSAGPIGETGAAADDGHRQSQGPATGRGSCPPTTERPLVAITLLIGFLAIGAALVATLSQAPPKVISSDAITVAGNLGSFEGGATVCQADEHIPASTSAIRISLIANIGPAISAVVLNGSQIIARGQQGGGWASGSLTLPLQPVVSRAIDATICLTRNPVAIPVGLFGNLTPQAIAATSNGEPLPGRMRVEYLASGRRSWFSLARYVAIRLGLGHVPSGAWIIIPLALAMASTLGLGTWLMIREAR